ncbi:hypothetical protein EB796_015686 [Bugula neritina]|uniref:C2H2-type domain-containing protein n=1 Tax=Bugula neritina TaxID=10212 RepID=A0A7J7JIW8_BUGNE|nr:hypothetical protein EB796_015686 [Bugula neritina]
MKNLSSVLNVTINCSECGNRFKRKYSLATHMSTHTGEKPFHCSKCDYKCAAKSNLAKHMLTHTGENLSSVPYVTINVL